MSEDIYYSLVIFLSLSVVVLLVRFIGFRKTPPMIIKPLYIISLVLIPISIALVYSQIDKIQLLIHKNARPKTEGVIIESRVVGDRAIRPEIKYQYTVDSVTYTGVTTLNPPMFGNKRKQYDVAHEIILENPVGSKLMVAYNPRDPSDAIVPEHDITWDMFGKIGFGSTLFLIALFGILLPRKKVMA